MNPRTCSLGLFTTFCLTACSHGGESQSAASVHHSGGATRSAAEAPVASSPARPSDDVGYAPRASAAPSAPSGGAAYESEAPAAQAEERPGLGTSWGEAVASHVTNTSFVRSNGDSPYATAALFYNDEDGVEAAGRGRYVDWSDSVLPLAGGNITVSLTDTSGRPLRAARVDGRTIAVGNDGDRYVVRVENRTPIRIETVATVDGLDVVDGDDGDWHKRGYVIAPYDTLEIEGFRESEGSVRAFRFGSVGDSYAARMGKDRNVGVVGIALFRERGADWRWTSEELDRRETADPFPGRFAPAPPPSHYRAR